MTSMIEAPDGAPQHIQALALANRIRLGRAQLKREVRAGEISAAEVLRSVPECAESMGVGELLRSQRRWGRARARRLLFQLAVNENRTLGAMTARQRRQLAEVLEKGGKVADLLPLTRR